MHPEGICAGLNYTPLYRQVAASIRYALGGKYPLGEKLPTAAELAAQYGVSLITVKEALRLLRAEGLISSGRGLGISAIKVNPIRNVAILIELDYESPGMPAYYRDVVESVRSGLNEQGFSARIYKGHLQVGEIEKKLTCKDFCRDYANGRADAVIAVGTNPIVAWNPNALDRDIPVLGTNRGYRNAVLTNSKGCMDIGVLKLFEAGCRRVAAVGWEGFHGENKPIHDYYKRVLTQYGLESRNHWFLANLYPLFDGAGWEAFREIWTAASGKPDGLFVLDGELLPGVLTAMSELGLEIGEDIQIVSRTVGIPDTVKEDRITYLSIDSWQMAVEIVRCFQMIITGRFTGHYHVPYRVLTAEDQKEKEWNSAGFRDNMLQ